jgi:hypothetical protein
VTFASQLGDGPPRVIVQLLEGGSASGATSPDAAVDRLREACATLPISDVCLGWGLPVPLVEAVAGEAERQGAALWLWHPLLSGDGQHVPRADQAVGRGGHAVQPPMDLPEFSFDCAVRPAALEAALARLDTAAVRHPWQGILLDKIRWPSPSRDPAGELACFCDACRSAAAAVGIDLEALAGWLGGAAGSPAGRVRLLRALLEGDSEAGLDQFLAWRCERITAAVAAAAGRVRAHRGPGGHPMRVALDVFAPALGRLVGQDLAALANHAEFLKAMLYLGTHGPAGLSYELCRLARWLEAGAVPSPVERLAEMVDLSLPAMSELCHGSLSVAVFDAQTDALRRLAGRRAAAGIDAVAVEGLAVLPEEMLEAVALRSLDAGVPIVLSWDLMSIPPTRLERLGRLMGRTA